MTELLYEEHPCTLRVPGWEIPAMLSLPAHYAPGASLQSAILLVPGSLYSDVNGDYPVWNIFPHTYAHLARKLSALGHAVYRYAKLGPGTGSTELDEADAIGRTWEGRLQITIAAFRAMQRELATRQIDVARLIGAGHSEGSVAVSRLALTECGDEMDGVVLLSGPSIGILGIMREQIGHDAEQQIEEILGNMPAEGRQYMHDVEATDPTRLVREMTQPMLVVQGGNDSSVRGHHGARLHEAAGARSEYAFFADLTHMYKIVPADLDPQAAFGYPGDTDARVTDAIDQWIRRLP